MVAVKSEGVWKKIDLMRKQLGNILIDREEEIDLALTALLAREHLLLVGPPGCGKSLLLDSLMAWMGGKKFSALLTRFSVPEELFGPVSLSGLKEDRFVRVTTGKLPEADFVFLDEIFKGSSAILNTLLKILNERTFDPGSGSQRVPLKLCVAAANEWPAPETAKDLSALFDRFAIRKTVTPIRTQSGRKQLLWESSGRGELTGSLCPRELEQSCAEANSFAWTKEAREALETVLHDLSREGIRPGDRRQVKAVGVIRAYAYLQGAVAVLPEHLEVAAHCLWDDPLEQPEVVTRVIRKVANPPGLRVNQLLLEAEQILSGTDSKDLTQAATAAAKLGELDRRLEELASEPRALKVRSYLQDQLKRLRLASLSSL